MCCRCPPMPTLVSYLLLSILITSYYFYKAAGVDNDSGLISIKSWPALENESFLINPGVKRTIEGDIFQPSGEDVAITPRGFNDAKTKTLIKRKSLCKIIENYIAEDGICPIPPGSWEIPPMEIGIDLVVEMWSCKKFHMEILKDDGVVALGMGELNHV